MSLPPSIPKMPDSWSGDRASPSATVLLVTVNDGTSGRRAKGSFSLANAAFVEFCSLSFGAATRDVMAGQSFRQLLQGYGAARLSSQPRSSRRGSGAATSSLLLEKL